MQIIIGFTMRKTAGNGNKIRYFLMQYAVLSGENNLKNTGNLL